MKQRQQSSTSYLITFLMVDSADHVTGKTGLTPTVTISKDGAAFGSPSGAVSEIGNGWYALAGDATDRDTLGDLLIHATGTGADPVDDRYCIVPWNPFDATRLGLTAVPNAVAGATGGVAIVGSEMGLADSAITSAKFASGAITAAAIAADAIGASELAADAVAEIWAYTTRTLTQSSTSTTDSTAAGSISRRRGDSWSISLTLGAITGYTSLWFTVKAATSDADTAAIFQIKKNASGSGDGLLYVNGATASSAALGSITVSDATTGAVIIALDETITDDLTPASYVYDCQALISGSVSTPDSGTFTVTADVTRVVA